MPLTLVHAADCHLDAPSRSLEKEVRTRVEESARSAFEALVDLALQRQADCLVLAGDLFDRDLLRIPTEVWLPEVLGRGDGRRRHRDRRHGQPRPRRAGRAGRPHRLAATRFHLVRAGEPTRIDVRRGDGSLAGVVLAAGHATARERENLAARFATCRSSRACPSSASSTHRCRAPSASTIATPRARPPTSRRRRAATGRSATSTSASRSRRLRSRGTRYRSDSGSTG